MEDKPTRDDGYDEHMTDPKKNCGPLICTLVCGGVISFFFGHFWLYNPDVHPGKGIFTREGNQHFCWTGENVT